MNAIVSQLSNAVIVNSTGKGSQ